MPRCLSIQNKWFLLQKRVPLLKAGRGGEQPAAAHPSAGGGRHFPEGNAPRMGFVRGIRFKSVTIIKITATSRGT